MEELLKRVLLIARHIGKDDVRAAANAFLIDVGIPTHQDGYKNLLIALDLYYRDTDAGFTKEIYPEIRRIRGCQSGCKQVEKTIRYSIKTAWDTRDPNILRIYFPAERDGKLRRPTNAEFISKMARILELWKTCSEEGVKDESDSGTKVYAGTG